MPRASENNLGRYLLFFLKMFSIAWVKTLLVEGTIMPITTKLLSDGARWTLGLCLGALAANAMAESPPGSIPVGPMFAYPELEVATRRDSNIALVPDALRKADTIWYLRPSVRLDAKQGVNLYELSYKGEYGRYNSQKTDDFDNHDFGARANMTFDARNNLKLGLQYLDRVDPRGTLNLAATPTPNKWRQPGVTGLYTYGAENAKGKLEFQGGYLDKRYVNNRALGTSALDLSQTDYGGTFLWRVMPKTYATFNLKQSIFNYKESTSTLDSKNTYALVGLRWEATAATSGKFSVGHMAKKFDSAGQAAGRNNQSGLAWEGAINWKPLRYSSVDFITQRTVNDSTGLGNFTINQTHQVLWTHAWTSRISSKLSGSYSSDKFNSAPVAAAGGADRDDTTKSAGLRLDYSMRRWLKLGAEYLHTARNSNDTNFDYKRDQLMLLLSGTL